MIKLLNVYYPTRTVILILCEAFIVCGSFVLASAIVLGGQTFNVLGHDHGIVKIAILTVCTILCAYYFDLYEPQHISARWEIYFRLLLVMGCLAFALSAIVYVFPQAAIARFVFLLGLILVVAGLIAWRSAFEWISGHAVFQERVYVLGEGERASAIIETIREHREAGMVVVGWDAPAADKAQRRKTFATAVEQMASETSIDRIVVALDDRRGELPVDGLLAMRFRGVTIEEVGSVLERLTGKLQLDGLRPSDLLFCEGFRMKPSQQFLLADRFNAGGRDRPHPLLAAVSVRRVAGEAFLARAGILSAGTSWTERQDIQRVQVPHHGGGRRGRRSTVGSEERSARDCGWDSSCARRAWMRFRSCGMYCAAI